MSSLIRLTSYKPASQLPLPVVSGFGSLSRLSRGCGGECSGKGVVCRGGGVIPQLVWRFVFAFAYGGRNGIGFIFLRFLSFLCLDCGLSNQAKKKKKNRPWTEPFLRLTFVFRTLTTRGNLIGQGNRQHLTLVLILFL